MRIVELGKYYPPDHGGIENYTRFVAEALAAEHDVRVLVFNRGPRTVAERVGGIPITRVASLGRVASQEIAPGLPRALAALAPDLIHLHAPNPLGVLACHWAAPRVPVIVTHHSDVVRQKRLRALTGPSYRRLLRRAVGVTVLSPRYGETSPELAPVRDRLVAIPYGVDERRFARTDEVARHAADLRASLPGQGPVVAFVGRHVHYKGLEVLIAALAGLPSARALIAGDGPMRGAYEAAARSQGVADRVRFLGLVDDATKVAVYHAADVFALPCLNRAEAFGEVQVEAQLCGLPVVASSVDSGVVDVTRHGETGLCVPPGDAAALAGALRRLFDDPDLGRRLGEAGRRRARETYVEPVVVPRLRAFVRACAEAAGTGRVVDPSMVGA
jgi:rhamnosyl/mannosyltransferase